VAILTLPWYVRFGVDLGTDVILQNFRPFILRSSLQWEAEAFQDGVPSNPLGSRHLVQAHPSPKHYICPILDYSAS